MGARDPDAIAPPPHPLQALTLAEMHARRWLVIAACPNCHARTHVDLAALRRLLGDDYVLWGRTTRCKAWVRWEVDRRCPGSVTFLAQSSLSGSTVPLRMTAEVRDAVNLRSQADHRR
ncbi:MAG TPA: hypothetical protein VEC04_06890 [Brevundimonas sp.]|nr:hypothetical protein [Brevundimonas sp.]